MANDRIKGITIQIEGNATPLKTELKSVDKSLRETQTNLKDVNKLLKMDPGNITLLKQKQDLLSQAIKDTKEKLDKEKEALQQLKAADQTPEVKKQTEALERQIIADEQALKDFKGQMREFGSVAGQALQAAGDKVKAVGEQITAVGQKLRLYPLQLPASAPECSRWHTAPFRLRMIWLQLRSRPALPSRNCRKCSTLPNWLTCRLMT